MGHDEMTSLRLLKDDWLLASIIKKKAQKDLQVRTILQVSRTLKVKGRTDAMYGEGTG